MDAIFKLANCYYYGILVDKCNYNEAFKLLLKCSQRGIYEAQYLTGKCCELGQGTICNLQRAFMFYQLASGDSPSDKNSESLLMDMTGNGLQNTYQNNQTCNSTYSSTSSSVSASSTNKALRGHPMAQFTLALWYDNGIEGVVEANKPLAIQYAKQAADRGLTQAQLWIAQRYHHGLNGIKKSILVAYKYYKLAAEGSEDAFALYTLGMMHFLGNEDEKIVPKSLSKALDFFSRAAYNKNDSQSQYQLGVMYEHGLGVERDMSQAIELYEQSVRNGNSNAQLRMGMLYMMGVCYSVTSSIQQQSPECGSSNGSTTESIESISSGSMASDVQTDGQIDGESLNTLSTTLLMSNTLSPSPTTTLPSIPCMITEERRIERDVVKAIELFRLSANQHDPIAQFNLGLAYLNGDGIERDVVKAKEYFTLSALGHCDEEKEKEREGGSVLVSPPNVDTVLPPIVREGRGYMVAQYRLALCYENNEFDEDECDVVKAKYLYSLAAGQGHVLAQEALERLG